MKVIFMSGYADDAILSHGVHWANDTTAKRVRE